MTSATSDTAMQRVLKLAAANLPAGLFRLNRWTEVPDPAKFLQLLQSRIRQNQAEPTTRDSTLGSDAIELLAIIDRG